MAVGMKVAKRSLVLLKARFETQLRGASESADESPRMEAWHRRAEFGGKNAPAPSRKATREIFRLELDGFMIE